MARRIADLEGSAQRLESSGGTIEQRLAGLEEAVAGVAAAAERTERWHEREREILRTIYEDERHNRERVALYGTTPEYEAAYTEPDPLLSVTIPTATRYELLRDRSLPSVLVQGYSNLEIVVVGDNAPAETAEVIEQLGDPRLRYTNLGRTASTRGGFRPLARRRTVPSNAALWSARGR